MRLGNKGLAVSTEDEVNGKWVDFPEWGLRVRICGVASPLYRAALRAAKLDRLPEDQREAAINAIIADNLVRDWEGAVDVEGKAVPFSAEMCRAVLLNTDNRRLLDAVVEKAMSLQTFNVLEEDDRKN